MSYFPKQDLGLPAHILWLKTLMYSFCVCPVTMEGGHGWGQGPTDIVFLSSFVEVLTEKEFSPCFAGEGESRYLVQLLQTGVLPCASKCHAWSHVRGQR